MLKIENLKLNYENNLILNQVNYEFNLGKFYAILGANGCGKSSLLKCILNLNNYEGSISYKNTNLKTLNSKELAKIISYIPQKSSIFMPFIVKDFILMGLFKNKAYFFSYNKDDYKKLDEVLELLELKNYKNRLIQSLSGGEFARVLMARALIEKPKILLIDEVNAALDINYSIYIMNLCKKLAKENICVIMVIHDLYLALNYCSDFIFIQDKKIVYTDFNANSIKNIFKIENQIHNINNKKVLIY